MSIRRHRGSLGSILGGAATILALAVTLIAALTTSPADAAPITVRISPGRLHFAYETSLPHVEGHTIVSGRTRIAVPAATVAMLGRSGSSYLVATTDASGRRGRVLRVAPDGHRTVLSRGAQAIASKADADGTRFVTAGYVDGYRRMRVVVRSATTGAPLARRTFPAGFIDDVDHGRVAVTAWASAKTWIWNPAERTLRTLHHTANVVDLSARRWSFYTADPDAGGCIVVASLTAPRKALWRSCNERVMSFSPSGRRMMTMPLLTDGPGTGVLTERGIRGHAYARYKATFITAATFLSDTDRILDANGPKSQGLVECIQDCVRVSRLTPSTVG